MSSYLDLRSKRTEAVAPRSLFGTNVEIRKPGETPPNLPKQRKPKRPIGLEKFAKYRQPGDVEKLEGSKVDYKKQWDSTSDAKDQYREVHENALYFKPDPHTLGHSVVRDPFQPAHITDKNPYKTDVKLNATDVAHPELFNTIGLGNRQDYNYDAHRDPRLRSNSNYKHIGNALGKQGQVSYSANSRTGHGNTGNPGQGEYHSPIVQSNGRPAQTRSSRKEAVPSNIRHRYGTQMINDLIGDDEKKVSDAVETVRTPIPRARTTVEEKSEKREKRTSPGYESLSNHLRYDHFSGVPVSGIKSLNTESYTNEVFTRSAAHYPPKFGILKNEDTKWNEDNVIRDRMKKAWDEAKAKPKD
ncbi:uncharacterized protein LOC144435880 [Glandiceps talaboti]